MPSFRKSTRRLWLLMLKCRRGWLWQNQCWRLPCNMNLAKLNHKLHRLNEPILDEREEGYCHLDLACGTKSREYIMLRSLQMVNPTKVQRRKKLTPKTERRALVRNSPSAIVIL